MSNSIEMQIAKSEEQLRLAMLGSDVNALDKLLAPELMFINHLGQVVTKKDDLAAHESGTLKINVLTPSEQHIQLIGDVAIVHVRMRISGRYADTASDSDFRFTRVWAPASSGSWHVVAAHSCIVT